MARNLNSKNKRTYSAPR